MGEDFTNQNMSEAMAIWQTRNVLTDIYTTVVVPTQGMDSNKSVYNIEDHMGPKRDPLSAVVPMTLVYTLVLVAGMVGNICTCVVIARNKYMHTATNYYLFSLAISDLLLLVLGLPQEMYLLWERYPYIFGEAFCIIRGLTSETSTNASILTITAFTMERYMAICHPLRAHTMSKLSRAVKFIIIIWICSALCAVPLAYQFGIIYENDYQLQQVDETAMCSVKRKLFHAFEISTGVFFILPMTLLSIIYVFIGLQLRRAVPVRHQSTSNGVKGYVGDMSFKNTGRQSRKMSRGASSRKAVVKMLVAVVVAFFLCWAPFHAQRLMATYVTEPTPADMTAFNVLTYISGITYYVSATINPILYSIMSLKFRHAFRDTLAHCFGRRVSGRGRRLHATSRYYNSTFRSGGFETTDFTLVSESPHAEDEDDDDRTALRTLSKPQRASRSELCDTGIAMPTICVQDNSDHDDSKKITSSISNSSLQMLDESAFDGTQLSDYIEKLKDSRG